MLVKAELGARVNRGRSQRDLHRDVLVFAIKRVAAREEENRREQERLRERRGSVTNGTRPGNEPLRHSVTAFSGTRCSTRRQHGAARRDLPAATPCRNKGLRRSPDRRRQDPPRHKALPTSPPPPSGSPGWPRPITPAGCKPQLIKLGRVPLLVVDEVGYIPFEAEAANLFFQLVSSRYERASLIVISKH